MKGKQNGHVNRKKKLRSDFLLIQLTRNKLNKTSTKVAKFDSIEQSQNTIFDICKKPFDQ